MVLMTIYSFFLGWNLSYDAKIDATFTKEVAWPDQFGLDLHQS